MKQKNLWIAALALGITLSAHGQQSGGGISPTMLQQIKQSYQGTPADKAIRNAITNNDINDVSNKVRLAAASLSNWPPYSIWYPSGKRILASTRSCISLTTLRENSTISQTFEFVDHGDYL